MAAPGSRQRGIVPDISQYPVGHPSQQDSERIPTGSSVLDEGPWAVNPKEKAIGRWHGANSKEALDSMIKLIIQCGMTEQQAKEHAAKAKQETDEGVSMGICSCMLSMAASHHRRRRAKHALHNLAHQNSD